ncbi:hypothetical protein OPT61_g124 [Boeremia exigua]|uniref:Uncharacterized protein n=1 Tax=Boeremia exigua TaxID=749465 RepID=A0ACC2IV35_9PLEO|nr:hypothetical protein OPT61_g124 [Boeremia exigua]
MDSTPTYGASPQRLLMCSIERYARQSRWLVADYYRLGVVWLKAEDHGKSNLNLISIADPTTIRPLLTSSESPTTAVTPFFSGYRTLESCERIMSLTSSPAPSECGSVGVAVSNCTCSKGSPHAAGKCLRINAVKYVQVDAAAPLTPQPSPTRRRPEEAILMDDIRRAREEMRSLREELQRTRDERDRWRNRNYDIPLECYNIIKQHGLESDLSLTTLQHLDAPAAVKRLQGHEQYMEHLFAKSPCDLAAAVQTIIKEIQFVKGHMGGDTLIWRLYSALKLMLHISKDLQHTFQPQAPDAGLTTDGLKAVYDDYLKSTLKAADVQLLSTLNEIRERNMDDYYLAFRERFAPEYDLIHNEYALDFYEKTKALMVHIYSQCRTATAHQARIDEHFEVQDMTNDQLNIPSAVQDAFGIFAHSNSLLALPLVLEKNEVRGLAAIRSKGPEDSLQSNLNLLDDLLDPKTPLYLILRYGGSLLAITFVPYRAQEEECKLYLKHRNDLVRIMGENHFKMSLICKEIAEITDARSWAERKAHQHTHEAGEDPEICDTEVKDAGYRKNDCRLCDRRMKNQITDGALNALGKLEKEGSCVQISLNSDLALALDLQLSPLAPEQVSSRLPMSHPTFTFYRHPNKRLYFIFHSPDSATVQQRMKHTMAIPGLVNVRAKDCGIHVDQKIEIHEPEDLTFEKDDEKVGKFRSMYLRGEWQGTESQYEGLERDRIFYDAVK